MPNTLPVKLETILVVEDDKAVLEVVVAILENANFRVLSAINGAAALELAKATEGEIHLLLSDLDMPHMNGADLGEKLKEIRTDMRVMLMSGGAGGSLLVLNYGWAFIQKPFVPVRLVDMVNRVLHTPDRSQPGGQGFDSYEEPTA